MAEARTCPRCGAQLAADAPDAPCPACLMKLGLESWENQNSLAATMDSPGSPGSTPSFEPPQPQDLADQFPQFEILELLGYGGMGAVYKARQKSLDRLVALKIIKPDAAGDAGFAARFAREARSLAKLNHANIVGVYDFGQCSPPAGREDGQSSHGAERAGQHLYYFVMEYVDGANLRRLIESKELTAEQAIKLIPQICEALQFAHDEGIVHRDIKPENILVEIRPKKGSDPDCAKHPEGRSGNRGPTPFSCPTPFSVRVKIADFGLAKLMSGDAHDHTLTGTHQVMGTPRYMAPEQMEGSKAVDHRADIYSLGVVFYEMLTGELPLGRFDPPSRKATIDEEWDQVVLRTLEKEPDRRYQHASEVKSEVERLSDPNRPPVRRPSPVHDQPGWAASESETTPHYGLLMLGGVMALLGLLLLMISTADGGFGFAWIGLGIALAGGGCFTGAFNEPARLPVGTRFNAGLLMHGGVWVFIGFALLIYCFSQERGPWSFHAGNAFVWVGIGLVVTGGGCFAGAWIGPPPKVEKIAESAPRFSRKAVLGACWAPLFFLAIVPMFVTTRVESNSPRVASSAAAAVDSQVAEYSGRGVEALSGHMVRPSQHPAWWQWLLMVTLLPLGLTAPFGATILGLMAISNIRHSYGRLTGMPLALADALFYPLLILDGLIYGLAVCLVLLVVFFAETVGARGISFPAVTVPAVLLALPACIVVDFLLVRAAWRRATRGMK